MLTPRDIHEIGFAKAVFGGYDMEAVDDFLEIVADDYAKLYKDNAVLKSKIKVLVDKIEEYRQTEDSMRMALLTAQKTSEDLLKRAKHESTTIVAGAEAQADARLSETERMLAFENSRLLEAQRETYEFIQRTKKLIEIYNAFLEKIENTSLGQSPKAAPSQAAPSLNRTEKAPADEDVTVYAPEKKEPAAPENNALETAPAAPEDASDEPEEIPEQAEAENSRPDAAADAEASSQLSADDFVAPSSVDAGQDAQPENSEEPEEEKAEEPLSAEVTEEEKQSFADVFDDISDSISQQLGIEENQQEQAGDETPTSEESQDEDSLYAATMRLFYDDDDDSRTPRPKFNFENLQFGSNYDNSDK